MKNPNGYGTVVKLSGKRRRPYVAKKTKGFDMRGYPIPEIIGYFATREEALIALAEFNRSPWSLDGVKTTFAQLFDLWKDKKAVKLGESNRKGLFSAYHHCRQIHKMRYTEIKAYHMQNCIDACGRGYSTQSAIKNLFVHLDRFALEMDIVSKCYSGLLSAAPVPETTRSPFCAEEIAKVWAAAHMPWVDSVIMFLYTGFRISELLSLKVADVDMEQGTMRGGTKTQAGKGRIVPIHSRLLPFVQARMQAGGEYLFADEHGGRLPERQYYAIWREIMQSLGIQKTPHECRHTLRSLLDSAGANQKCINLILGHKDKDVGRRVYTHKTVEDLKVTIEMLE